MTRQKSRSAIAGKSIAIGIVSAIALIVTLYILSSMGYQFAFAEITRESLDSLETQIIDTQVNIENREEQITNQHIIINDNRKLIDIQKDNLREIKQKANTSWDAILDIQEAEKELETANTNYTESRNKLSELLKEKSDYIKQKKQLEKQLEKDTIALKSNSEIGLAKKIGVVNSNVCITMIKNNITTTCPTYKELILLDNSDTRISGKFTTDDNGYFHRDTPPVTNSFRYYDSDTELRMFIDPPREMLSRIKVISLEPNFDTYTLDSEMFEPQKYEYIDFNVTKSSGNITTTKAVQVLNQTQEYSRILFHDRYVDESCKKAVINADKWEMLLPDTINYMRNNCDESQTSFISKEIIPIIRTEQDITTSQKYKDQQRLDFIKEFCIFKFKACTE